MMSGPDHLKRKKYSDSVVYKFPDLTDRYPQPWMPKCKSKGSSKKGEQIGSIFPYDYIFKYPVSRAD